MQASHNSSTGSAEQSKQRGQKPRLWARRNKREKLLKMPDVEWAGGHHRALTLRADDERNYN